MVSCTTMEALSREACTAAELAASNKVVKYAGLSLQGEFVQTAVESHSPINKDALQFITSSFSVQWPLTQQEPGMIGQLSRSMGTGKAGDQIQRRLQRDHLPVPAIINGFANGELTRSHFNTRSLPASLLQTSYLLCVSFNL